MMKTFLAAAALATLGSAVSAETINFDDLNDGQTITGDDFSGVTFSAGGDDLLVADLVSRANLNGLTIPTGFSLSNAVESDPFTNSNPFTGVFSISGVRSVSVGMGDFGSDADNLFLTAFDGDGNEIASDAETLGGGQFAFLTLSIAASIDIASVSFGSSGQFDNSVFFDDFTFNTTAVPLPAGLPLLLAGLAVFGIAGRKRG
ncbi:MAG: VPLPA-CTERM sorting domain-containing protein [Pseudomonadota bacterium]